MISIISALDPNRVVGREGRIPWNIPEEMAIFKKHTTNNVVMMGQKTFETCVKGPLPGRYNIVLNHEPIEIKGVDVCTSIPEALDKSKEYGRDIFVIGGANVYAQMIDLADTMYLSYIKKEYEGDIFFPEFNEDDWHKSSEKDYDEFTFVTYKRK